ncbi:MAG: excinuclease ABC subunit A [Candidatus Cloacimonadota bacterium]|nr:MAG: excinuclease ABC subunit A [Candidatus Cloacimonadota bacterium]
MKTEIRIKGAREHNLKNIDITIPRNKLVVCTGVSGSGKSSFVFDTLYAEGQRRYVESLSSYARQFLGQMEKPKVDYVDGLSPAISIEQKSTSKNPRSTVGTVTEIYDYLRILFSGIGIQHCYKCGEEAGSQTVDQMVKRIMNNPERTKIQILAPVVQNRKGEHKEELEEARREGFVRVSINGKIRDLSEEIILDKKSKHNIDIIVDRLIVKPGIEARLADSIETALKLTSGFLKVDFIERGETKMFSESNSCNKCGISYPDLSPQRFSFNSPLGMCPACNGLGSKFEFDPELVVPDSDLSIQEGAVIPWGKIGEKKDSQGFKKIKKISEELGFSLDSAWKDIPKQMRDFLLWGKKGKNFKLAKKNRFGRYVIPKSGYEGIIPALARRFQDTNSEYMKKYYLQFLSNKPCTECKGKKLRPESLAVKVENKTIDELTAYSIKDLHKFFEEIELTGNDEIISKDVLKEIKARLGFLINVGLHYLTLDRSAPTLSGGEAQRIRLAGQIGNSLVGVMYILDEPSIGLHQRDNARLINMLCQLRDAGNTVLAVEHDEEMIRTADQIIDFGPGAGVNGGEAVAQGTLQQVMENKKSLTGKYMSGELKIEIPKERIKADSRKLKITGASQNNLKSLDVEFPVGTFNCVTGVSGSGKSSLINQILYPVTANALNKSSHKPGKHLRVEGIEHFDKVIAINQQPIGRTPRSNPATYIKLFDSIREIFAELPASKIRGYKSGRFSFNVKGGRCESCRGAGVKQIEMHFLPDIFVTCEVCGGQRYTKETLSVRYKGKNIAEVLDLDVQEAIEIFENIPKINKKLQTLADVGLEYIKLGQSSTTLSGGEAQRIKLARELSKTGTGKTMYILDEPTTGLHFDDIKKLLKVLKRLVKMGNTVIVIEHNLDVIKCADYIVDLGPEGGEEGGMIIGTGTPEEIASNPNSYTGQYLKKYLK